MNSLIPRGASPSALSTSSWLHGLCAVIFFAFIVYLYVYVTPLIPWNGDDWVYLVQFRDMFPSLTRWNPARIFPEVLQPLVGWTGSVIYSFSGDYVQAQVWSHALWLAAGITALAMALYTLLRDWLSDAPLALFAVALFMAVSFSLFKSRPDGTIHLFYSDCVTVTFFYVLPNLLNSILVCYILHGHVTGTQLRPNSLRAGALVLLLFLAQFSMTFGSALAAVFAGWICLWRLLRQPAGSLWKKARHYAQTGTFFDASLLCIMGFWVLAAALDMCGGRYSRVSQSQWDFAGAWQAFAGVLGQCNPATLAVVLVIMAAALSRFMYKSRRAWSCTDSTFFLFVSVCLLSALALLGMDLLISARTLILSGRISAVYNVFFCMLLATIFCACYLLQEMPRLKLIAPIVLALLFVECQNAEKPWARQPAEYRTVVEQWLTEVRKAEQRGDTFAVITVPKADWPHPPHMFGKALAQALFAHGVTAQRMDITIKEAGR